MNASDVLRRWAQKCKGKGRQRLLWLLLLAGLLLLLLPAGREGGEAEESVQESWSYSLEETERRLAQTLSKIEGAGEVTVMLTVQDGPRKVLAEDRDQEERGERSETVVLSRGGSLQETVTVQEVLPNYQGALLVCPGGDDPEVRLKLTEATAALTGLGSDKISISKGK